MPTKVLILLDVPNLMHRAHWAHGDMHNGDQYTGCLYGIMRDCRLYQELYPDATLAFCFDSKHKTGRQALYPDYKANRQLLREAEDEEAREKRFSMYEQTKQLWSLLPQMGVINRFGCKGLEGDDIIASLVQNTPSFYDKCVMVSSDQDLYQLLDKNKNVVLFKPIKKQEYTEDMLMGEYGVMPCAWASCKAWSGCTSDNIEGLKGVAEKTACKWILGKASEKQKALFEANLALYNRNIQLVKLPFPGTPKLVAQPQESPIDWSLLEEKIGISTAMPPGIRKSGV